MAMLNIQHDININYRVDGSGSPAWLLFNGATLPLEFWGSVAENLAQTSTVIRFDQRNAGDSQAEGAFTLNDTAADAAAILAHLDVSEVITVGHAWGGRAAQVFVRDYPHLVRGLVVCGTGGQFPPLLSSEVTKAMRKGAKTGDRPVWEAALESAFCAEGYSQREPEGFAEIADLLWAKPPNNLARWDHRVSPSVSYWGSSSVPTLLLYGREDKNGTPENAEDLAGRIPGSRLVFIEQAGHFVVREAPARVLEELLEFALALEIE
ncbi:MAG: alpha/beta hydrolase [Gammaproteobacteria bacterium]|nr:alpha/beta hydrolase [Gammaproteobacteria bacterium]